MFEFWLIFRGHLGFLIKIKKILECICVQCGRLKIDSVSGLYCSLRSPRFVFGWLSLFSMGSSNPVQIVVSLRSLFLFVQVPDRLITVSNDKNYLSCRRRCTSVEVKRGAGEERRGCTSLHPCLYFTSLLASRNFFLPYLILFTCACLLSLAVPLIFAYMLTTHSSMLSCLATDRCCIR